MYPAELLAAHLSYGTMMIDPTLLLLFIPTMLLISITPGMCMTLAMTLGMTIGLRRTFAMMWGEVVGVALVAALAAIGVATVMIQYPTFFAVFKIVGGLYLGWLGVQMWLSRGRMSLNACTIEKNSGLSAWELASQGFVTAVANPKGWAFFIALLPPFISQTDPIGPHNGAVLGITGTRNH